MAKLERWIVASKTVDVLDAEMLRELASLGATPGGGWFEVHQHIHVNPQNKEKIEELLLARGYRVSSPADAAVRHPDRSA